MEMTEPAVSYTTYQHFVLWSTMTRGSVEVLCLPLEGTNCRRDHRPQTEWLDTTEELTDKNKINVLDT